MLTRTKKNEKRKLLHHRAGIGEIHHLRVILRQQVSQDAQNCRCKHLVKAETDECLEPSPEQKFELLKNKKGDEDRTKQADYCAGNCAIGNDGAHHGGEDGNQHLNKGVDDGVIGVHHRLRHAGAFRRLRLAECVLNARHAVGANDVHKILGATVDKATERLADTGDSFTSVHGRHTLGFGVDYRYWTITRNLDDDFYGDWGFNSSTIVTNNLPIPAGNPNAGASSCPNAPVSVGDAAPTPLCGTGNAIADMMLGYYSNVGGFVPGPLSPTTQAGNPQDHVYHYFAPYGEDDWKITPKLSINYGLRWDFRAATYEINNKFFWLDTKNTQGGLCYADPKLSTDGVAPGVGINGGPILRYCGSVPRPGQKNPFAPRLGINYRLNDRTVVRAGYGIFYTSYEGREIDDSADIYPYSVRNNLTPATVPIPASDPKLSNQLFPAYTTLGPFPESTLSFIAVIESENPLDPYVQTWTLSVERQLGSNTTLEVNYIGNHGTHLLDRRDISQPYPVPASSVSFCQQQSNGQYVNLGVAPCSDFEPAAVSELQRVLHRQRLPWLLPLRGRERQARASRS